MRLNEKEFTQHIRRANQKKWLRKVTFEFNKHKPKKRNRKGKEKKKDDYCKIIAPTVLDLYKPQNHTPMVEFVSRIKNEATKGDHTFGAKIHICFRDTKFITASAGVWLLACMESLMLNFPHTKFRVSNPPKTPIARGHKTLYPVVDSVLNRIGFYSAIGLKKRQMVEVPHVRCWEVATGNLVAGETIGKLLNNVVEATGLNDHKALYRPLLEAAANSVEHAYLPEVYSLPDPPVKWWCFATIMNNQLITLVCDLGVGIPNTLPRTQGKSFFDKFEKLLGHPFAKDWDYIKGALQVKRSNTKLDYRGKGGKDLQSIIEQTPNSQLRIFSNRGFYKVKNVGEKSMELGFDNSKSINGTIVEWSVTLPIEDKR